MTKRRGLGGSCVTPAADRAYSALQIAAERIGWNQYAADIVSTHGTQTTAVRVAEKLAKKRGCGVKVDY